MNTDRFSFKSLGRAVRLLIIGGLTLLSPTLFAEEILDPELESEFRFLDAERDTVMTASRTEEKTSESIASSTILTQKDIERMGARTLSDALRIVPGLGVTQTGQGVTSYDIRGVRTTASEKVLMLLNGHPLDQDLANPGSTWTYDDMPVDTIKRIEVVRGSSSALYGANAMMAVINIITQTPEDTDGVESSLGVGNYNTEQVRLSAGKKFEKGVAGFHFNFRNTDGSPITINEDNLSIWNDPSLAPATRGEGTKRYDLEWNTSYLGFKLDGRFIDKTVNPLLDGYGVVDHYNNTHYSNYFLRLSRDFELNNDLSLSTQVFYDAFNQQVNAYQPPNPLLPNPNLNSGSNNTRAGTELTANYRLFNNNTLIGGFNFASEFYSNPYNNQTSSDGSIVTGPRLSRTRVGVYLQDLWEVTKHLHLSVGGRFDKYSDFAAVYNPRVGFNWEFVDDYSVKFSYGTAYRAPTPGEMDSETSSKVLGNPYLQPETSKTLEVGLVGKPINNLRLEATYFRTMISDMIGIAGASVSSGTESYRPKVMVNQGDLFTQGVELEGRYDFHGDYHGSYVLVNYVNQNAFLSNAPLLIFANQNNPDQTRSFDLNGLSPFVPRNRVNVIGNWQVNRYWNSWLNLLFNGTVNRTSTVSAGLPLASIPSYELVNLSIRNHEQIAKGVDVSLTIYNLLNAITTDPATSQSYPGDFTNSGRSFFGHVNYRF